MFNRITAVRKQCLYGMFCVLMLVCISLVMSSRVVDGNQQAESQEETPQAIMTLKRELESSLVKSNPGASVRTVDMGLVVEYKTQMFLMHNIGKGGDVSEKPKEKVGPRPDGFVIRLSFYNEPYVSQASGESFFGEFSRMYWNTYRNEIKLSDGSGFIICEFNYGARPDAARLDAILRLLITHGELSVITPWSGRPKKWENN